MLGCLYLHLFPGNEGRMHADPLLGNQGRMRADPLLGIQGQFRANFVSRQRSVIHIQGLFKWCRNILRGSCKTTSSINWVLKNRLKNVT